MAEIVPPTRMNLTMFKGKKKVSGRPTMPSIRHAPSEQ